jgi:hypothetical protein
MKEGIMPVKIVCPDKDGYSELARNDREKKYITLDEIPNYDVLIITNSGNLQNSYMTYEDEFFNVLERTFKNVAILPVDNSETWEEEVYPRIKNIVTEPKIGEVYIETPSKVKVPINSFIQSLRDEFLSDIKKLIKLLPYRELTYSFYQKNKTKENTNLSKKTEANTKLNFEGKEQIGGGFLDNKLESQNNLGIQNSISTLNNKTRQENSNFEYENTIEISIMRKNTGLKFNKERFLEEKKKFREKYEKFLSKDLLSSILDLFLDIEELANKKEKRSIRIWTREIFDKYLFFLEENAINIDSTLNFKNNNNLYLSRKLNAKIETEIISSLGININSLQKFEQDLRLFSEENLIITFSI